MDADLPSRRCTIKLAKNGNKNLDFVIAYDVEFYPYTAPGVDPVFAFCAGARVIVARCVLKKDKAIEILAWFEDEEGIANEDLGKITDEKLEYHYNSLTWSRAENGDPLLCVTGGDYRQIRVYNIVTRKVVAVLNGHGKEILDIAVSPIDPMIMATCSYDYSIRLWSLNPLHRKQPVAAICYGQNHRDNIGTIAYHRKGKYILSAGMDTKIHLWVVPDNVEQYAGTDKPKIIHYPHFSTLEVHTDFVDCVQWYDDLIISHAVREDKLILWKIDNFDSDNPVIPDPPIPTSNAVRSRRAVKVKANSESNTYSAWGGRFQRLLQFELPSMDHYYIRFSIFNEINHRPFLVAGNTKSKAFFWDLQCLEDAGIGLENDTLQNLSFPMPHNIREESAASTASSNTAASKTEGERKTAKYSETNEGIGNPFRSIKPDKTIAIPGYTNFAFRHFGCSRDGQWCVGVGDAGLIVVFHREAKAPAPESENGDSLE